MDFQGKEAALETAILKDDDNAIKLAIKAGANPNAQGKNQVNPVEYAVGHLKIKATAELLRQGANPNLKDIEGDSAVTLATLAYRKNPELLKMILQAGGDPNTRIPDGDPIIMQFMIDRNLEWIRYLKANGADINARDRSERPLVINVGISEYWDVLWCLLELGAKYDYSGEPWTLVDAFASPYVTPPDSPLWSYKVKVWQFLHDRGVVLPKLQ